MSSRKRNKRNGMTRERNVTQVSERTQNRSEELLLAFGKSYPSSAGTVKCPVPVAPDCIRVLLKYGFNVSVTSSAGEVDSYQFTGNGLFDPDVTGAGSQPLGFDQWHAFYTHNRVVASNIQYEVTVPDGATNDQMIVQSGVFASDSSSIPTTVEAGRSMRYSKFHAISGGAAYPGNRFNMSMETYTIMGVPKAAPLIDDNLTGTVSSNPTELWYWTIMMQPTDQAGTPVYRLVGTVSYLVDFFGVNLFSLSLSLRNREFEEYLKRKRDTLQAKAKRRSLTQRGETPRS